MRQLLRLFILLSILGLSSCRTSCGCPMSQVETNQSSESLAKLAGQDDVIFQQRS